MASETLTREALYALAWAEPMTRVAERYGVSSSFMARVCTAMNVPRPPMGYWTKLEFGKPVSQPSLPEARPFDLQVWSPGASLPGQPLVKPTTGKVIEAVTRRPLKRPVKAVATGPRMHALLRGIGTHFETGRENRQGYFRPNKKTLPDLVISKQGLPSAMKLANELYLAFEDLGHSVSWLPSDVAGRRHEVMVHEKAPRHADYESYWNPARLTAVSVGSLAIGLTIFETCEEVEVRYIRGKYYPLDQLPKMGKYELANSWTSKQNRCTGRFCIQAYSPYGVLNWSRQWRELKPGQLVGTVKAIAKELIDFAPELVQLYEQAERKAEVERLAREEQWRRWEEERRAKELLEARKKSKEGLVGFNRALGKSQIHGRLL